MIDAKALLADLQDEVTALEGDLRERCAEVPELEAALLAEFEGGRAANRTAQSYEQWREGELTQAAVHWILGCVFVRFMEDNGLVERPYLAGPGDALRLARDRHTLYFQQHPTETDREYLYAVFREVAALPAAKELFDERHNPLWRVGLSGDGATRLLEFWQRIDPSTGVLVHDFTDPEWGTRFLGDLYQDLSEAARKRYALLQTPEFVEEFILDRTLTPAIEEFGFREVRLIDPTCGSGHFLLGAFRRLFDLWTRSEPATNVRDLARRVLQQICGVDVNPFAVAIARFRLLVAALRASGITRLADAPAFQIHVAAGDSLLHGPRFHRLLNRTLRNELGAQLSLEEDDPIRHVYAVEDADELRHLLGRQYHAVVGNPPYITVKDKALNEAYRGRYASCHRQYSLAVPFMERFFDLALAPERDQPAGHVGMITANSFMKREFGKKVVEEYIPRWDLTHVIDTSGAYIPGHGTPTVILFGRNRAPVSDTVRAVMGIRGEPSTPDDPAHGFVWQAIRDQLDRPGSESEFVSVADTTRASFHRHPWGLGGGGAAELKELLDDRGLKTLDDVVTAIGRTTVVGDDDAWILDRASATRHRVDGISVPLVIGEVVRDWCIIGPPYVIYPYESFGGSPVDSASFVVQRYLWPLRTLLAARSVFGKTLEDMGRPWYEHLEHYVDKLRTPLSITFASVTTHNHFAFDRGGRLFKQSAPVIKLPPSAPEEDHIAVLGLLNSSVACFWMKQVFYAKERATGDVSTEKMRPEANRYDLAGTGLLRFPLPRELNSLRLVLDIASSIEARACRRSGVDPAAVIDGWARSPGRRSLDAALADGKREDEVVAAEMVALQEELDWECYRLYGLGNTDESLAPGWGGWTAKPNHRPAFWDGEVAPEGLDPRVAKLYEARRRAISENPDIALVETPVNKRLWLGQQGVFGHSASTYQERQEEALRSWLLDRLEDPRYWQSDSLTSCARLAEGVRQDNEFMKVAEVFRRRPEFDITALITELVEEEGVPFLPVLRYRTTGLRKRLQWERTWDRQRQEDAIDSRGLPHDEAGAAKRSEVGKIPVPPKYTSADFVQQSYWRLRGKLDVPKERFVLYPHAERTGDPTPVLGWAGWDRLVQAKALAAYYVEMKEQEGWTADRLTPLLAGLLDLLPWLHQWHNQIDPSYGVGLGDYFRDFIGEEARSLSLTLDQIRSWVPPAKAGRNRKAKG